MFMQPPSAVIDTIACETSALTNWSAIAMACLHNMRALQGLGT